MSKILVVDDSEVIRNLLRDYLADMGHTVDLAHDGQEGIEQALANDYSVVFCDIHMPKKNGYQVFREVSARKPDLFFVMTDSLPGPLAEMARQEGAHCCLTKPFDLKQVQQTLEQILLRSSPV
ncbi:MAG TPA: response regulator [Candidatus Deferrimicrobium sp.]|nr:response regulator [Candidatus Deferrimicrobium sp.]